MLAAPKDLRPLSLAVNSIALHALGDVPSPTIIGALKDALAPHCAAKGGLGSGSLSSGVPFDVPSGVVGGLGTGAGAVAEAFGMALGSGGGVEFDGNWEGLAGEEIEGGEGGVIVGISDACRYSEVDGGRVLVGVLSGLLVLFFGRLVCWLADWLVCWSIWLVGCSSLG